MEDLEVIYSAKVIKRMTNTLLEKKNLPEDVGT